MAAPRSLARAACSVLLPLLALIAAVAAAPVSAEQPCLKLVFNQYCLGGDINVLAQQSPPALRDQDGDRSALIYFEGGEKIYVLAWRGRIYKVLRRYPVASQLRYEEIYHLLRDKYGNGEDHSYFPDHARTPGLKQIAIRRGEGQAIHVWPLTEGWHIELSWTRELGLAVAYIADEIERQQAKAFQSGY